MDKINIDFMRTLCWPWTCRQAHKIDALPLL